LLKKGTECFEDLSMNGETNNVDIPPFVLSTVEGFLGVFRKPVSESVLNGRTTMTIIFIAAMAYSPNDHHLGRSTSGFSA
jgi:hypothetical protein